MSHSNIHYSDYVVPTNVIHLEITQELYHDSNVLRIHCHDGLQTITFNSKGNAAILLNCNNLEKLTLMHLGSYVYGDFVTYLGSLEIQFDIPPFYKNPQFTYDYLTSFENLVEYIGPIDTYLIQSFKNIRKLQYNKMSFLSIDDIPDTIESFMMSLRDADWNTIKAKNILDKKPNIRAILITGFIDLSEDLPELLQRYPNVYFQDSYTFGDENREKMVNNHNKKLISLLSLC